MYVAPVVSYSNGDVAYFGEVKSGVILVVVGCNPANPHTRRLLSCKDPHRVVILKREKKYSGNKRIDVWSEWGISETFLRSSNMVTCYHYWGGVLKRGNTSYDKQYVGIALVRCSNDFPTGLRTANALSLNLNSTGSMLTSYISFTGRVTRTCHFVPLTLLS